MKTYLIAFTAALFAVASLCTGTAAIADQLDQLAAGEVSRLNQIYGTAATFQIMASGDSDSTPDKHVTLSRSQIDELVRSVTPINSVAVQAFIIGHEMAHQLQFRIYGANALYESVEKRKVLECQADMLSATNLPADNSENNLNLKDFQDVLKVAFEIGAENYRAQDHPDHEQRRLATRIGLSLRLLRTLQSLPVGSRRADLEQNVARQLDLRTGEDVFAWSLRMSKQIVHFDSAATSLVSLGEPQITWDPRADHPFVTFNLPYKNLAPRAMHIELEVVAAMVPRFERSNTSKWERYDVTSFMFDLAPGEQKRVSGQLQWFADPDRMPRILYPPDTQTLFSAIFTTR